MNMYTYIYICIISTQNWEYGTTTEDELPIGSCGYDETLNEAAGVEIRHENHIGFGGLDWGIRIGKLTVCDMENGP